MIPFILFRKGHMSFFYYLPVTATVLTILCNATYSTNITDKFTRLQHCALLTIDNEGDTASRLTIP